MRTWLLAPDGVWVEVSDRLPGHGSDPSCWPWSEIVAGMAGSLPVRVDLAVGLDRGDLISVHGSVPDRWMANLIWSTLCTDRIDRVTVLRLGSGRPADWLAAVCVWAGRPVDDRPPMAWEERRLRWMLWAHSLATSQVPLDGARVVVGATRSR